MILKAFVPACRLESFNGIVPPNVSMVVPAYGGPLRLLTDGWLVEIDGPSSGLAHTLDPMDAAGVGVANLQLEVDLGSSAVGACMPLDLELRGGSFFLIAEDSSRPNLRTKVSAKMSAAGTAAAGLAGARFTRWRLVIDGSTEPMVLFERT